MTALTIRLPEDTTLSLKQRAASRGISLTKLMEALGKSALAAISGSGKERFRRAR